MHECTYDAAICVMTKIFKLIGGKWKPIILYLIQQDVNRFGALRKCMPRISKKVLTNQLRELEEGNLIHRDVQVASSPQVVVYSLTEKGDSIRHLVDHMVGWGLIFFKDDYSDDLLVQFDLSRSNTKISFPSEEMSTGFPIDRSELRSNNARHPKY